MKTINIPIGDYEIKRGDTINEFNFAFDVDAPVDLTGATIRMDLYLGNTKVHSITNGSGITLIDTKSFKIDQLEYSDNDLPAGTLKGDLEITDSSGKRLTYVDVVYTIVKDYTR